MPDKTPERAALEKEADELDLKVPGNIGDEKLKARIEEAKAAQNGSGAANAPAAGEQTSPQVTGNPAAPAVAKPNAKRKAMPEPEMDIFEVIDRVRHSGKLYKPGDPIELDINTELPGLIAAGVIADPDTE